MRKEQYGISPAAYVLKDMRKLRDMMSEREVKEYLLKKVARLRGEARKVRWEGRRSAPDWRVMVPGYWPFFLELKATGKKPTRAQDREIKKMRRLGELVEWANSPMMIDVIFSQLSLDCE